MYLFGINGLIGSTHCVVKSKLTRPCLFTDIGQGSRDALSTCCLSARPSWPSPAP